VGKNRRVKARKSSEDAALCERHLQSRPYSNQKLGRRDQSAASSELFLAFTRRSFPTGTRDGGRREPCEPQPCSLGERNVCRDLAAVGIPRHAQESPVRGSNEGALGCTSRQRNTHNIELREVRYPWHPWHARTVAVHEALTRNGRAVCRCGVDESPGGRLLEIPQWMLDSVACCRMRMAKVYSRSKSLPRSTRSRHCISAQNDLEEGI
jgi:hypothetical protein